MRKFHSFILWYGPSHKVYKTREVHNTQIYLSYFQHAVKFTFIECAFPYYTQKIKKEQGTNFQG